MFAKIDWANALITGTVAAYACVAGIIVAGEIASNKSAKNKKKEEENKKKEEENERLKKRQKDREEYYRKFAEYQDRVLK